MTKKQVWQYRCEHCGKRGLSAGHMRSHEKSCTANPERVCRMHAHFEEPQKPIAELIASIDRGPNWSIEKLRKLTDNCPMCNLAAIRQSGICKWDGDPESTPPDLGFCFKAELKSAWDTINDARSASEQQGYY